MTLCVVSSNEDAQQQPSSSSSNNDRPMETDSDQMKQSQDSGYGGSQPHLSSGRTRHIGQNLRITACANQGGRKYMEDRVHVHVKRDAAGDVDWTFVAVYDGHGGPEASEYCRRNLLKNIMSEKNFDSENDQEFLEAIRNGFLTTHHEMWKDVDSWERTASGYPSTAGTTASCAFIRRGKVYVGHVGDSAILLTRRNKSADEPFERLTTDHKPELPAERRRIEASGGQIMQKQYVYRVVWTRAAHGHVGPIRRNTPTQTIPFLAVARSLGDFWSFIESTQEFSVSPEPDVSVTTLDAGHHSLILASDGLTNVMSAELEAAIMHDLAEEERQRAWFKDANEHPNHARIIMRRTMLNWRRFRADNISVLAVIFDQAKDDQGADEEDFHSLPDSPTMLPREACVDAQLAEHPLSLMHVTNERVVRYATAPVALRYNGQFDNNFCSVSSVGPGFISHDAEEEAIAAADGCERAARLQQYYDCLGVGERDVTPENQPPPAPTAQMTNRLSMLPDKKPEFTSAAARAIHDIRSAGDATAAAAAANAAAAAASAAADGAGEDTADRPVTPPNKPDALFAVLRSSRSTGKRKSRIMEFEGEEAAGSSSAAPKPSTSKAREGGDDDESMEASESESDEHDAVLKLSLPFAKDEEEEEKLEEGEGEKDDEREQMLRTPSPIGDAVEGERTVRATPICNAVATERELQKRVMRSAAATTSAGSQREMVVVERPATRRSSARRLQLQLGDSDAATTASAAGSASSSSSTTVSTLLRTPKHVLEVGDTLTSSISRRTRSRNGEVTPPPAPSSTFTPATSMSGSRKRPRAAAGGGAVAATAAAVAVSTATPLLARISLAEMNENADSDPVEGTSSTAAKAGPTNKSALTGSPWVQVRCEGGEGRERRWDVAGDGEMFYEVVPSIDDVEGDGEPPAKRFRLWGMLKKWWSGGG